MILNMVSRADKQKYIALSHEFYHSAAVLHPVPDSNLEVTFDEAIKGNPCIGLYLLDFDGQTAGYLLTAVTYSQEAGGKVVWIDEIYVKPDYRGKGIGGAAIKEIIDAAKRNGVARIRLEYEPDNTAAVRLYEKLGFKKLGYSQMCIEYK